MTKRPSLRQYLRYFAVGGAIGFTAALGVEICLRAFPAMSPAAYGAMVAIVYGVGVLASFIAHGRYTFSQPQRQPERRRFASFVGISLLGAVLTSALSTTIKFLFQIERFVGQYAGVTAFILAATIVSAVTYLLNARWVFGSAEAAERL